MTKPVEINITEDDYEEHLNEVYGTISFAGMTLDAGRTMRELDPTMFRCGMADQPITWQCGECGDVYDEEDEAQECCEFQCEECGTWYVGEFEALSCCEKKDEVQK